MKNSTPVSDYKKIPGTKLNWRHNVGGKPARVLKFEYTIGKNGNPGKGSGFGFRIDYQDYATVPPPGRFRPHYHICAAGYDCKKHYYFDEIF